jgi:hypothetical protein
MFRMWGKIVKDTKLLRDTVICISDYSLSRTAMVFQALDEICYEFDLGKPIWLDSAIQDFKKHDKVRFTQDNFIEIIDFDFLEMQVIEE